MRTRVTVIVAVVMVVIGVFVCFWLGGEEPSAHLQGDSPRTPVDRPTLASHSVSPSPAGRDRVRTEERVMGAEAVGEDQPRDYGPRLQRSNSSLEVTLFDAKRRRPRVQPHATVAEARIWRKLGPYWLREETDIELGEARFTSLKGEDGWGLEPGEYELEFSMGSYGKAKNETSIGLGTQHRAEMRLAGYERVIKLVFMDSTGSPMLYLPHKPVFSHCSTIAPASRKGPPDPLRERPMDDVEFFSESWTSEIRVFQEGATTRFATEHGAVYLRVVAGLKGKITMREDGGLLTKPWGGLRADFKGGAWEGYEVVLETVLDYRQQLKDRRTINPDNPGDVRLVRGSDQGISAIVESDPRPAPDPLDLSTLERGRSRIVVSAPQGFRVRAEYDRSSGRLRPTTGDRIWDVTQGSKVHFCATDGRLGFVERWVEVDTAGGLRRLDLTGSLQSARLKVNLPPTVAAWGHSLTISLSGPAGGFDCMVRAAGKMGDIEIKGRTAFFVDLRIDRSPDAIALEGATLLIGINPKPSLSITTTRAGTTRRSALSLEVPLTGAVVARMMAGDGWAVDFREKNLLAMRCVGALGEGLPWVQISVVDEDKDVLAQSVREGSLRRLEETGEPRLHIDDLVRDKVVGVSILEEIEEGEIGGLYGSVFPYPSVAQVLGTSDAGAAALAPKAAVEIYGQEMVRRYGAAGVDRLNRFNAWYNTFRKAKSDPFGYFMCQVTTSMPSGLIPGKRYVIYFWSNCRDDLHPDGRVVFVAQAGTTDLGVIELPSYR